MNTATEKDDETGQATNRSPLIDTRSGAKGRDDGEAGSGAIRDDDGRSKRSEGNGMRQANTQGGRHPPHRPTHEGTMAKIKAPLSTHHIDIADIMRQAARSPPPTRYHIARTRKASRSRPQIRHRPARRHEERGVRAKRGKAIRKAKRQADEREHDRRMTERVSTMGRTEAAQNTMTARHHR